MAAFRFGDSPRSASFALGPEPVRMFGRERELNMLNDLLDHLRAGSGAALIVRGEPGIGKSALLAAGVARARDEGLQVFSAVGVQSETHLPFAGLHQVLAPIRHLAEALPARLRAALLAAFGMANDVAPELFLVALATLELIADTAEGSPVLLVVEDAQWLDHASGEVLAFVARRLEAVQTAMLVAIRDGHDGPFDTAGLADLRLGGLDEHAAGALLDARNPALGPVLRRRLLEEAAGNPLALVELPSAVCLGQGEEAALLAERLPLTPRLERAFAARGAELPQATRSLLLVSAADEGCMLGEVLDAVSLIEGRRVTIEALAPAAAARLVEIEGTRLRFRHPLVRSAIYHAAGVAQRRGAHAALAEVLVDPDRSVWHRAAAALAPDERLAAQLEEAADRAGRRGAVAVEMAALERAADLSVRPEHRGRRLLRAAELAFELARPRVGLRLLRAAELLEMRTQERTHLAWLREMHDEAGGPGATDIGGLEGVAERLSLDGHVDLAVKLLLRVAERSWWGNPDQAIGRAIVAAVDRLPIAGDEPGALAALAKADPVRRGAAVLERISHLTPDAAEPVGMYEIGLAASAVWAYDLALRFLNPAVDGLRAQGRLGLLAQALVAQAWAAVHLGREPLAVSASDEAVRLAAETGEPRWAVAAQLAQATIAAERGDFELVDRVTREGEASLLALGATSMLALVRFVRGRGAVAHQRYAEGFEQLRQALEPSDRGYHPFVGAWGLGDLVEAAAHTGQTDTARSYLDQLETMAAATSGSLLRAQAGYARPMVADDDHAEALYRTAIESDLANWPCYRGRMLLWYGRWLRRQRRVAESRVPLRRALEGFDALAFPRLGESARQELRASGEASRRRVPEAWDQLSPQELQIARLAATGLSNREIGLQLYISHRTVGGHLYRIFPKLGLTSRAQLRSSQLGLTGRDAA
jgi:DNA-binding CsgD family transcriptional regulator